MTQSALATLYRFELKMLLRDKRTVLLSIVLPVLVMPLILFSSSLIERAREKVDADRESDLHRPDQTRPSLFATFAIPDLGGETCRHSECGEPFPSQA